MSRSPTRRSPKSPADPGPACRRIIGSFVGGFLGYVLFDKDLDEGALQASGVVGAIIGAVMVLPVYRSVGRGRLGRV